MGALPPRRCVGDLGHVLSAVHRLVRRRRARGLEAEKRLTAHVTLLGTGQVHYIFSGNENDFPTMFGGDDSFVTARLGINYHFSPYEGILWERKVKRTIKLTSGKAGS